MKAFLNRSRLGLCLGLLAALSLVPSSNASQIAGSISLGALGAVLQPGAANLLTATTLTPYLTVPGQTTNNAAFGAGAGDYLVIPIATLINDPGLNISSATGPLSYTFTSSVGTFGSVTVVDFVARTASFLDLYLEGVFTPAGVLAAFDPTPSSLRLSATLSGSSVSWSATMTTPPAGVPGVPEPATLAMFGGALIAAGVVRKRSVRR